MHLALLALSRRIVAVLALTLLVTACFPDEDTPLAPSAAKKGVTSSGNNPPGFGWHVKYEPHRVGQDRRYRLWFLLENNTGSPQTYILKASAPSEITLYTPASQEVSIGTGSSAKRWIPLDFYVTSSTTQGHEYQLVYSAHDARGDAEGVTTTTTRFLVVNEPPVAAVVGGEYRVGTPGMHDTLTVWVYNPRNTGRTICLAWLNDEGWFGQTTAPVGPQGQTSPNCTDVYVEGYQGKDIKFSYEFKSGATAGQGDRQVLQAFTTAEPDEKVYAYLKTMTVDQYPKPAHFYYAWMNDADPPNISNPSITLFMERENPGGDRQYVQATHTSDGHHLQEGTNCNWSCLKNHARNYPSDHYIMWDEPDQPKAGHTNQISPTNYAAYYYDVVKQIRSVDPTARFSPAGFASEAGSNSGMDNWTTYAEQFYEAYKTRTGEYPSVEEWRFNIYETAEMFGDTLTWRDKGVIPAADWAVQHGARLHPVFGTPYRTQSDDVSKIMDFMRRTLEGNCNVSGGTWWAYVQIDNGNHYLADSSGYTAEGNIYATWDVPSRSCAKW